MVWCLEVEVQWHGIAALVAYEYLSRRRHGSNASEYLHALYN